MIGSTQGTATRLASPAYADSSFHPRSVKTSDNTQQRSINALFSQLTLQWQQGNQALQKYRNTHSPQLFPENYRDVLAASTLFLNSRAQLCTQLLAKSGSSPAGAASQSSTIITTLIDTLGSVFTPAFKTILLDKQLAFEPTALDFFSTMLRAQSLELSLPQLDSLSTQLSRQQAAQQILKRCWSTLPSALIKADIQGAFCQTLQLALKISVMALDKVQALHNCFNQTHYLAASSNSTNPYINRIKYQLQLASLFSITAQVHHNQLSVLNALLITENGPSSFQKNQVSPIIREQALKTFEAAFEAVALSENCRLVVATPSLIFPETLSKENLLKGLAFITSQAKNIKNNALKTLDTLAELNAKTHAPHLPQPYISVENGETRHEQNLQTLLNTFVVETENFDDFFVITNDADKAIFSNDSLLSSLMDLRQLLENLLIASQTTPSVHNDLQQQPSAILKGSAIIALLNQEAVGFLNIIEGLLDDKLEGKNQSFDRPLGFLCRWINGLFPDVPVSAEQLLIEQDFNPALVFSTEWQNKFSAPFKVFDDALRDHRETHFAKSEKKAFEDDHAYARIALHNKIDILDRKLAAFETTVNKTLQNLVNAPLIEPPGLQTLPSSSFNQASSKPAPTARRMAELYLETLQSENLEIVYDRQLLQETRRIEITFAELLPFIKREASPSEQQRLENIFIPDALEIEMTYQDLIQSATSRYQRSNWLIDTLEHGLANAAARRSMQKPLPTSPYAPPYMSPRSVPLDDVFTSP